jgi:hypothetical protein
MAGQTGRRKFAPERPPAPTALVKGDPTPTITSIGQPRTGKRVLVSLAQINCRALSVKPGNSAGLVDKDEHHGQEADQDREISSCQETDCQARHQAEHCLAMLRRANGASVAEIIEATDWQPQSVRGFFSGALVSTDTCVLVARSPDLVQRTAERNLNGLIGLPDFPVT